MRLEQRTEAWLVESIGGDARVVAVAPLAGGLSKAMFRIDLSGAPFASVVLRRWPTDEDWTREATEREAAALTLVSGRGVGAPELIASDPTGAATGRPATLMTSLSGIGDLAPTDPDRWIDGIADGLVPIHDVPSAGDLQPCERFADLDDPERRAWLARVPAGDAVLELARAGSTEDRVFSHGDYQHFNLLWTEGRLTGVVDWPMAGVDDRGKDVGHCMLNLAVLFSADHAWRFLQRYQSSAGALVPVGSLLRELLDYSPEWQRFIPIQVNGRIPVDPDGMPGRVADLITRIVSSAG